MAIQVTCDSCFYSFSVKDENAGKRGKCPECGDAVAIPGRSGARATRAAAPAAAASRTSRPAARPAAKSGGSSSNVGLIIGGVVGGVILLAAVAFFALRSGGAPAVANAGGNGGETTVAANTTTPAAPVAPSTTPPAGATATPGAGSTPTATSPTNSTAPSVPPAGTAPIAGQTTTPMPGTTPAPGTNPAPGTTAGTPAAGGTPGSGSTSTGSTEAPSKTFASVPDLVDAVKPSVVRIAATLAQGESTGTGFVIDKDGTVVTNYHVIEGASKVSVFFADGTEGKATGYQVLSPKMDLAILKIDTPADKLHPLKLAKGEPRSGETVVAIGMPFGLSFTTTKGDVSAYRNASELKQFGADLEGMWVQSTTPISPGNSGGPLFNMQGEVIGANTLSIAIQGAQNLNFCTSAENIRTTLGKKASALIAMAPSSAPPRESRRGGNPRTISNETTTLKGKKLLANLQEVVLREIDLSRLSLTNSTRVQEFVTGHAEKMWRRAGVNVSKTSDAQAYMIVMMKLKQSGTSTASTIEVNAIVFMRDEGGGVCKVFDQTDDCGQVSQSALAKGTIPERTSKKVGDFFARIEKAIAKAKEDIAKEEGKDKPKEDTKDDKKK